jgi:predicted metal-dependent hydrolase
MTRIAKDKKITIGSIPCTLTRSARRSLSVAVGRDGEVVIRAPIRMPEYAIQKFVLEKEAWIEAKRSEALERNRLHPPISVKTGERLPWLGGALQLQESRVAKRIRREGDRLLLPEGTDADALIRWIRKQARDYLNPRLDMYAQRMGLIYKSLKITGATGRWGSCSYDNRINLSWHLMLVSPECADYVIVHELCHILYKDHSPAFWVAVEEWIPDYRTREKELKDHVAVMDLLTPEGDD